MRIKKIALLAAVLIIASAGIAKDEKTAWKLDIDQYGVLKSASAVSGFEMKGGPLRKRSRMAHEKYGYWWAVQGNKKFDLEPGIKEELKDGEKIFERNGIMGDHEYKIEYSEKIIFKPESELKFSYEALFSEKSDWTYPLFVGFSFPCELVEGRGYIITTIDGSEEKGVFPLKKASQKEKTLRKIKTLGISTNKGAVYFYAGEKTEIWLLTKKGAVTVQMTAENYPLWQKQIIEKGQKKTLDFSIKLPNMKQ